MALRASFLGRYWGHLSGQRVVSSCLPGYPDVVDGDADLVARLPLHVDVHVGVAPVAHLHDGQARAGTLCRQLMMSQMGQWMCEGNTLQLLELLENFSPFW